MVFEFPFRAKRRYRGKSEFCKSLSKIIASSSRIAELILLCYKAHQWKETVNLFEDC